MAGSGQAVRLIARVGGEVQGVGYRAFTQRWAEALGVAGYARNEPDGSVLVVAEGSRAQLDRILVELRRGPAAANVRTVGERWDDATGEFNRFQINLVSPISQQQGGNGR